MRTAYIKNVAGNVDRVTALELSEFPFFQVPDLTRHAKHKKISYLKVFATFDIETSTVWQDPTRAPEGFMYHWQMKIGGAVVYGRTWEEWVELMQELSDWLELSEEKRLVVYVHNLSYEFQFIRDFLKDDLGGFEVFATARRTPIYVMCGAGFEFRCSYKLTNMGLEKACQNELGVMHPKAAGDLDYKIVRTSKTPLTDTEFGYCIADVVSLYELIERRLINESDNLDSIPLTSTGYVRRECRNACRKDKRYRDRVFLKQRMSPEVYTLLKEAGRGGNTHANRFMSARIWDGGSIASFDVVSSYPAQMMLKRYPSTKFTYYGEVESEQEFKKLLGDNACIFRIIMTDVKVKKRVTMPYIPTSKLLQHGSGRYDNGRVLECSWLAMTVTDIDWKIIEAQYNYNELSISDFYISKYDYLPEPIRQQVMSYYRQKTELKAQIEHSADPEERANLKYLYGKAKARLNAIFGMSYTDPIRPTIEINTSGEWIINAPELEDSLEKFYKSRNNFLVYAWGVWITAHARKHLQDLLDITGDDTIYCDTDSSKAIVNDEIVAKIEQRNKDIESECDKVGAFIDCEGKRYYLGIYENDGNYSSFCTLGAKKYAYNDESGFHITISGVQKKLGAAEMKTIDNFKPGFIFKEAGGKTLYYNDDKKHYITVDGVKMLTASNIGMIDSTYELGITAEYAELLALNVYEDLR